MYDDVQTRENTHTH